MKIALPANNMGSLGEMKSDTLVNGNLVRDIKELSCDDGELSKIDFKTSPRFAGIKPLEKKVWLASPTMHKEEREWVDEAIRTNWVSTVGANINEVEKQVAEYVGCNYSVGLSCGTTALHLAVRLAGEKIYGVPKVGHGSLEGRRVFAADMTFFATVNPITYEGGEPVFIDTERDTWNMDPAALERAFKLYPDVKLIVIAHLYGTPSKIDEIRSIADAHGALIVEDAAESLGATYKGRQTGTFGDFSIISFNGNKIITGSAGGMFLCSDKADADKIRKWSTQSREAAPWYQHEELGYNYRMSNIIAGVIRGQLPHLEEHIAQKKAVFDRYKNGLADLPVKMNPIDAENSVPNYWLSCMMIDEDAMAPQVRSDMEFVYKSQQGKSCPQEILEALSAFNAEGRPIWKPMHMQPIYKDHGFVKASEDGIDVGADIFRRGVCLPSDNKMTAEEQNVLIEIIHRCFK